MYKFLSPESVTVRYGTTIATFGRVASSLVLTSSEPLYAGIALASQITGLASSHTKPGVAAEAALMFTALGAMGASAITRENPMMMWMAGVGMLAFGNVVAKNIRYTKLCPEKWRRYEQPRQDAVALKLTPRQFPENSESITKRKMFVPGMIALAGITPFIVDGVMHGLQGDADGWNRAVAGSIIFASNLISSVSIPQKQKHWSKALAESCAGLFSRKKNDPPASSGPTVN